MKEEQFVIETVKRLLESHMPPGYEKAKRRIEERFETPDNIERAAWELYEYKPEDRETIAEKLRRAAKEVITDSTVGAGEIEVGLLAPDSDNAEIERTFSASDRSRVLELVKNYAEEQGYNVQEPPQGSESLLDWRFGGRRLTTLKR